jgi:GAF domain-containing protein
MDGENGGRGELELLRTAVIGAEIAAPETHSRLLEMIVETAASVISAAAGALFLIDAEACDLVCEVGIGGKAEEIKQIRVPLGHGIAGGVAASGLPLAVSQASSDPRWARDIGARVGYTPESIVCVPLFFEERVIGALELLDKQGAPSFTPADIDVLSRFANQAAVAIEQSRTRVNALALIAGNGDEGMRGSLELAALVREIAQAGDRELAACRQLLLAFAAYLRGRPK